MNALSSPKIDEVVMMHCKLCGHTQPKHLGTCEQCGMDMGLYGEPFKTKVREPHKDPVQEKQEAVGPK